MIKKVMIGVVAFGLAIGMISPAIQAAPTNMTFYMNGKKVVFDEGKPYIDKSKRTMVPVRFMSDLMGYTVNAIGSNQALLKEGSNVILITKNSDIIKVNGVNHKMDAKATPKDGHLYIPIRDLVENLQGQVHYNGKAKRIDVKSHISPPVLSLKQNVISQANEKFFSTDGIANPFSTVHYVVTDSENKSIKVSVEAERYGRYNQKLDLSSLKDGNITIAVSQTKSGITGNPVVKTVLKDTVGASILNTSASEVLVSDNNHYEVKGKTEPNATVIVSLKDSSGTVLPLNPTDIKADMNGNYSMDFDTSELKNTFTVTVEVLDTHENVSHITFNVTKQTGI